MFQLLKMYRGPHVLTACPVRPLQHFPVGRDSQLHAWPEHTCSRWISMTAAGATLSSQRNGCINRRTQRNEDTLSSSSDLICRRCRTRADSFQNLMPISAQQPQDLVSSKPKLLGPSKVNETLQCTLKYLAQNPKAQSTYDCSNNLLNRPQDISHHPTSVGTKNQCPHNHLFHKEHVLNPISYLTHRMWPHSVSMLPGRALHRAAFNEAAGIKDCLSLENEERCRQDLTPNLKLYEEDKGRRGVDQTQGRWASVLVSLCSVKGEPAFLFTLRSSTLKGRHKGDVSFAGGKRDLSDKDVVATALREAQEELGVSVETEKVWGILKPLRARSGMLIAPVLANLGAVECLPFKPNPGEVDEIFTLSLSHLCNPLNRGYTHFRTGDTYGYTLPVFRNGKHRVWGLTAVALDITLKLIVPP